MKKFASVLCFLTLSLTVQAQIPSGLQLIDIGVSVGPNVGIRHAGDGSGRKFLIDQDGIVRVIDAGNNLLPTAFLNITGKVACCGERGLLGLAFHPDYETNGLFFVSYTKEGSNTGDSIIERYSVSAGDPNVADAASGVVLMRVVQLASNHNGGDIHFGPDGYLYISLGDGGPQGNPGNEAQELDSMLGKILRIDVDQTTPAVTSQNLCGINDAGGAWNYAIPNDNPFVSDNSVCQEIWGYGLRNPWRFSFDSATGDMFVGDVGQGAIEEVSRVIAGAGFNDGINFGWRCFEGNNAFNQSEPTCDDSTAPFPVRPFLFPILTKTHSGDGVCAVTGGFMYRGPITALQGQYIYGDYCTGEIWIARDSGGNNWVEQEWLHGQPLAFNLTSFGEDEAGNVYVSDQGGDTYQIFHDIIYVNGFD